MSAKKAKPDLRTLGGRIESCLKPAGKTVRSLATALGVPAETVKKWIANEEYPSLDKLERMAVVLGIPYGDQWLETGVHSHA